MPASPNDITYDPNEPDEVLNRRAHAVQSPFADRYRGSEVLEEDIYFTYVRSMGEFLAAGPFLRDDQIMSDFELLDALRTIVGEWTDRHAQRLAGDELALAHAAMVYKVCSTPPTE